MSDTQALVIKFEQACINFSNPSQQIRHEAEKFLQQMENQPQPYEFCSAVLERLSSQLPRFHAANILRKAIVREWAIIPEVVKAKLSSYIMNYVINGGTNVQAPVRTQLLICYAMMVKLSWLEAKSAETKKHSMSTIQTLLQNNDWNVRVLGMNVLTTLISEFSAQHNKSSQIGMSWEFHERCRVSFQAELLPQCFEFVIVVIKELVLSNQRSDAIAKAAIKLLNEILTWDFSPFDQRSTLRRTAVQLKKKELPAMIQPSTDYWKKALTSNDLVTHVINLHMAYRDDVLMPHLTLQALVQISSVSQKAFADDQSKATFLPHLLNGVFGILHIALSSSHDTAGHEVYHLSLCLFRVLSNFGLKTLLQLPNFSDILQKLSAFTNQIVQLSAHNFDDWFFDSLEHLFDTWSGMVELLPITSDVPDVVANALKNCCSVIFSSYIDSRLKFGKNLDAEDEDDERTLDEQLTSLASLGRQEPEKTLAILNTKLSERLRVLQQLINSNEELEGLWNDIDCLFQVTGYVLGDDSHGETPVIPYSINCLTKQQSGQVFFDLVTNIFNYAEFEAVCLNNGMTSKLSPYMGEQLIWLLTRWTRSYLLVDTSYYSDFSPALKEKYCANTESSRKVINFLLNKILVNLFKWQGEPDLATATCKLLQTLVKNKEICKCLVFTDVWKQLIAAEKDTFNTLKNQQDDVKATLIESLLTGCTNASNNDQELMSYLQQLLTPLNNNFCAVIDRREFASDYQALPVLAQVSYCLEKLVGVVRASSDRNLKIIFQFFIANKILERLVALADRYHLNTQIVLLVLKFFEELAKAQLPGLSFAESKVLCEASLQLIQTYRKHNSGRTFHSALAHSAQEDQFLDVLTLINILTHIISKDFLDFDQSNGNFYGEVKVTNNDLDVSIVVFMGLNLILPLITLDMLQFPKLSMQYFTLVTFMFEIYPQKAAQLPSELFEQLVTSIVFGIRHPKTKIAKLSFEALKSMADYNFRNNRIPFRQQEEKNKDFVSYLLQSIFSLILFEVFSDDLLEAMSEALFVLMLWDEKQYQSVINGFVENEKDASSKQRLIEALSTLRNGLTAELNRDNERKFVDNVEKFLLNVRTFMRKS